METNIYIQLKSYKFQLLSSSQNCTKLLTATYPLTPKSSLLISTGLKWDSKTASSCVFSGQIILGTMIALSSLSSSLYNTEGPVQSIPNSKASS